LEAGELLMEKLIQLLAPEMQPLAHLLLAECARMDLNLLIYCTRRSDEEQARLFRRGREILEIRAKAIELEQKFGRADLAAILLGVGPQEGQQIVTCAGPGQSLHNYGLALDAVPLRDGKPVWGAVTAEDIKLWNLYGEIAEKVGWEWAGRWKRFREFPHIQKTGASWQELIRRAA
jgi:peptidoglycan L-alanyl-D-glutamate endopeptidase CwlK